MKTTKTPVRMVTSADSLLPETHLQGRLYFAGPDAFDAHPCGAVDGVSRVDAWKVKKALLRQCESQNLVIVEEVTL